MEVLVDRLAAKTARKMHSETFRPHRHEQRRL